MRLTSFTDYSIRVLIYLAVSHDEQPTIREIAERFDVSRNHLMKVVHELSKRGYLTALRGKHGGLRLNIAPVDINIGKLISELENDLALTECLGNNNQCILTPACELKTILAEALQSFFATLDEYTLEDILRGTRRTELVDIINIERD